MVGKARYDPRARIFINLPPGAIESLWESFNDVADGFGINLCEMQLICQELASELDIGRSLLDKQVQTLFAQMDLDENALVDAIEFMSTLAMASGMSARDKLEFVFTCFDFDGAGQLSVDEVTLAFRCALTGLCKLTGEVCPCEEELEVVAMRAFSSANTDLMSGVLEASNTVPTKVRTLVSWTHLVSSLHLIVLCLNTGCHCFLPVRS
jgi:Ca2+-binding EF-hand superfamily protein|mmetsp:Transcript_9124/g.28534  ORF Transcript_9124/g.28534 Transcript_9124/m.28534 type:complete len:209 (-) Transcript_9124:6862-7488(-)